MSRFIVEIHRNEIETSARRVAAVSLFACKLVEWLQHPQWKYSSAVNETPVQMAYNTDMPLFQWLEAHPEAFVRMTKGIKVWFSIRS